MKLLSTTFLVGVLGASLYGASLDIEQKSYKVGEEIKVSFIASDKFPKNAWVGIIPSNVPHGKESVNDQHDLAYQYLNQTKMGTLTFKAPTKEGQYDFRMNDTDSDGKEVASISFKVVSEKRVAAKSQRTASNSLAIEKFKFKKGEDIKVTFSASDTTKNSWVGIIPSTVPHGSEAVNDQHDLAYQYLNKKASGELIFKAPMNEGNFDLRMNDTDADGQEIGNVSFTVY